MFFLKVNGYNPEPPAGDMGLGTTRVGISNSPDNGFVNIGKFSQACPELIPKFMSLTEIPSYRETREWGKHFFSENKKKIKQAVCNNKTIKERVLQQKKTDINWLIDQLYTELKKEFKISSLAKVLAVYVGKIGIRKLCD